MAEHGTARIVDVRRPKAQEGREDGWKPLLGMGALLVLGAD
jgi:hypothetical protein